VAGGLEARNRWIRAVNALIANLEMAEIEPVRMANILGPVYHARREAELTARE
jgi:hypothetical protein